MNSKSTDEQQQSQAAFNGFSLGLHQYCTIALSSGVTADKVIAALEIEKQRLIDYLLEMSITMRLEEKK